MIVLKSKNIILLFLLFVLVIFIGVFSVSSTGKFILTLFLFFPLLSLLYINKKLYYLANPGILMFIFTTLYMLLVFSPIPDWTYKAISGFNISILFFKPSLFTIFIYISSVLIFVLSYFLFSKIIKPKKNIFNIIIERKRKYIVIFFIISLSAILLQLILLRDIPLFNVYSRWHMEPKLVWIASLLIFIVPLLFTFYNSRKKLILWLVVSIIMLAFLGARNLPIKLIIAFFITEVYNKPKNFYKLSIYFVFLVILIAFGVGVTTKSGIYGLDSSLLLGLGLFYTDAVGPIHDLERIINLSGEFGYFHGKLFLDTLLGIIPGTDFEYANYQIGSFLSGRSVVNIDGQLVERSVSLAPTFIGASYADFGILGAYFSMFLFGGLLGLLHSFSKTIKVFRPFVATYAAYLIVGINVGWYNPEMFILLFFIIVLLAWYYLTPNKIGGSK